MSIPDGIVTFLFTDIEVSSNLKQKSHSTHAFISDAHNSIKEAVKSHNGFIFKTYADAFCCAFANANDAIDTSVEIQKGIFTKDRSEYELKVRTGIHSGKAEWTGDDYSGYLTLSRVQKIMSAAGGGQILISEDAYFEADDYFNSKKNKYKNEISFLDLKERKLKDVIKPVHLYQILSPFIPSEFPALDLLGAKLNNLPVQLTSFVGREKEIKEVKELLVNTHLLTLLGPAGTGKTRLSFQIGFELIDDFANGVWLVEFASLNDPSLVINEIASVLNLKEDVNKKMSAVIIEHLKDKDLLLIFDNCEHLIEECAVISQVLIKSCPKLKILASSREALRNSGEQIYHVPTLSMPDLKKSLTPELLNQYEAVRLFIDRAITVKKDFEVNNNNASAVAQLCHRLDGIPFAIELAAARINMLTVEKILDNINDRFRLLTRGSRTALPRQQTLRSLIDWSYDLLSEEEKLLLQRLSVFSGDLSLEAAEEVCHDQMLGQNEILDLLNNLLNKSLINSTEKSGISRYYMLETIRHYGIEKLIDKLEFQKKHFFYFLKLYENRSAISGSEKINFYHSIKNEQENLRAAINWAIPNDPEWALKLVNAIGEGWEFNGNLSEGFETYEKVFSVSKEFDKEIFADALLVSGYLASQLGNYDSSDKNLKHSLEIYKELDNKTKLGDCLNNLGNLYFIKDEINTAKEYHKEALKLGREIEDKITISTSLINIAAIYSFYADYENAYKNYEEGLSIIRELNDKLSIARILSQLAYISSQTGNFEEARKLYEESLPIMEEFGDHINISISLLHLGNLSYSQKKFDEAELFYEECLSMAKEFGYTNIHIHILLKLGDMSIANKNIQKAKELYIKSILMCNKDSDKHKLGIGFNGMGQYYFESKIFDKSAKVFGISESLFNSIGLDFNKESKNKFIAAIDELKLKLNEEKYLQYLNEGKALSVDDAIEYISKE